MASYKREACVPFKVQAALSGVDEWTPRTLNQLCPQHVHRKTALGWPAMSKDPVFEALFYLRTHNLVLTTAESCTAGAMVSLLAAVPGTGEVLESGYVVYSPSAKRRLLGVSQQTIERYGLTSEAVAWEMALGALKDSDATVAIASTGVAGPEPQDGIAPGTVCFAWAFAGEPHAVSPGRSVSWVTAQTSSARGHCSVCHTWSITINAGCAVSAPEG